MSKKIKNSFIKIKSSIVQIIKGRLGYHTNVLDIYANNNTQNNAFLDVYILDVNQIKNYIIKNITIPPKTKMKLPHSGSIELEYKEYIFVSTKIITDVDIFCNYIETEKIINKIELQFQNENGEIVTGIDWNTTKENNKNMINFVENLAYSSIPEIYYQIIGQKVVVYKTPNLKPPDRNFREFDDRYEIEIYSNPISSNFNPFTQSYISVSFNILTMTDYTPQWCYNTIEEFTELNLWNNPNTIITMPSDFYYLNFKDVINYTKPENFSLQIAENNLVELNFEYISNFGTLKVTTDYNVDYLIWKEVDQFDNSLSEDYYLNSLILLEEGQHLIKIDGIDGIFPDTVYNVYINKNQEHFIEHNIELNYLNQLQINVDDIDKDVDIWQISETTDFDNTWYSVTDIISVSPGIYFINFASFDGYTKPNIKEILLSSNYGVKTKFTYKYTNNLGQLKIGKNELLPESVFKGIKWRVTDKITSVKSDWLVFDHIYITKYGEYFIEIQGIEDYFENITDTVFVYKEQKTTYVINLSY